MEFATLCCKMLVQPPSTNQNSCQFHPVSYNFQCAIFLLSRDSLGEGELSWPWTQCNNLSQDIIIQELIIQEFM